LNPKVLTEFITSVCLSMSAFRCYDSVLYIIGDAYSVRFYRLKWLLNRGRQNTGHEAVPNLCLQMMMWMYLSNARYLQPLFFLSVPWIFFNKHTGCLNKRVTGRIYEFKQKLWEVGGRTLHNLYASRNIIWAIQSRRMRWARRVAWMGEMWWSDLFGKPEGKRLLRRPRPRWWNNIRAYLTDIGWYVVDWMNVVQDRQQWR
jgi:hypothetical protein